MLSRWYFAPLVVLALLAFSVVIWLIAPSGHLLHWLDEGGPVEALTVQLYLAAALAALLGLRAENWRASGTALALVLLACTARELDWHLAVTGTSMLRVSFYFGAAPLTQKLTSFAIVAVVVGALLLLLRRHRRGFVAGLRELAPPCVTVATLMGAMALTKVIDRSLDVVEHMSGVRESAGVRALQLSIEEPLEMALPLLVLVAIVQSRSAAARALAEAESVESSRRLSVTV